MAGRDYDDKLLQKEARCRDCCWFDGRKSLGNKKNYGYCRIHPSAKDEWPVVSGQDDWCAEWTERK